MVTCYIGLGSNLGDREYFINTAIEKIRLLMNTRLARISSLVESLPESGPAQGLYLNCAIEIKTGLTPYQLLVELQKIESDLGRVRTIKNGPRIIDLDILLYGEVRMKESSLCLPHPRMLKREFVMRPLEEIAPQVVKRLRAGKAAARRKQGRIKKKR
jgi:2-amino-4-hydroxy-6-hydroxymethyldihydropteridine diphosphokinase